MFIHDGPPGDYLDNKKKLKHVPSHKIHHTAVRNKPRLHGKMTASNG